LNLHVSTFAGLLKKDTTNVEVKKLLHLFNEQHWDLPVKWEEYYNNYTAKVTLKTYYTPYFLQKTIQEYVKKGWISYSYTSPKNTESFHKNLQVYYPLTISRVNTCVFRATYSIGNRTINWLIYPDQSVEFENQAFTWEEVQSIEPVINHMQWE
jgi:predicted DNA-binding transcriptional regulator